jgi:tetratricopeptide (TPR) repeat protein
MPCLTGGRGGEMSSLEEKNELLERMAKLRVQRGYNEIVEHLAHMPRTDLIGEPELGYSLASAWKHKGEYGSALELVRELAPVCREGGNDRLYRRCLLLQGAVDVEMGSLGTAEFNFRYILPAAALTGDYHPIATATMNLGVVFALRCEWHQSLTALYSAVTAYQRLGDELGSADCSYNIGVTFKELGDSDKAHGCLEDARRIFHSYNLPNLVSLVDVQRAMLFGESGDLSLASVTLDRATEAAREYRDSKALGEAEYVRGKLLVARGQLTEARELFVRLGTRAEEMRSRLLQAEAGEALAELEWKLGDTAAAVKRWIEAEELHLAVGSAARAAYARNQRDRCAAGMGL